MIFFPVCNKKVDTNLTLTKNIKPNPPSPQPLEHHPPTYLPTYAVKYSVHKCLCVGMRTNPRYHFHSPRRRFFLASESSQTHSAWSEHECQRGLLQSVRLSSFRHLQMRGFLSERHLNEKQSSHVDSLHLLEYEVIWGIYRSFLQRAGHCISSSG